LDSVYFVSVKITLVYYSFQIVLIESILDDRTVNIFSDVVYLFDGIEQLIQDWPLCMTGTAVGLGPRMTISYIHTFFMVC